MPCPQHTQTLSVSHAITAALGMPTTALTVAKLHPVNAQDVEKSGWAVWAFHGDVPQDDSMQHRHVKSAKLFKCRFRILLCIGK